MCIYFLSACRSATPQTYFGLAVLDMMNMSTGFAGDGLSSQLEPPSVKLVEGNKTVAMKWQEIIDGKIQFLEANLQKLRELKETPDTKDMLQTSLTLHEYVLRVCKNEYRQLAKLYDNTAPKEQVQAL